VHYRAAGEKSKFLARIFPPLASVGHTLLAPLLAADFHVESNPIKDLLVDHRVHNWRSDPYSRGAYAYIPAGRMDLPRQIAKSVEGTLFFAGEATHTELMGTVQGAIASGMRAADEVLAALK